MLPVRLACHFSNKYMKCHLLVQMVGWCEIDYLKYWRDTKLLMDGNTILRKARTYSRVWHINLLVLDANWNAHFLGDIWKILKANKFGVVNEICRQLRLWTKKLGTGIIPQRFAWCKDSLEASIHASRDHCSKNQHYSSKLHSRCSRAHADQNF
jgi:hypothetical protein